MEKKKYLMARMMKSDEGVIYNEAHCLVSNHVVCSKGQLAIVQITNTYRMKASVYHFVKVIARVDSKFDDVLIKLLNLLNLEKTELVFLQVLIPILCKEEQILSAKEWDLFKRQLQNGVFENEFLSKLNCFIEAKILGENGESYLEELLQKIFVSIKRPEQKEKETKKKEALNYQVIA